MFGTVKLAYPVNAFLIAVILMTSPSFMTANAVPGTGTLYASDPEVGGLLKIDPSTGVDTFVGTTMDGTLSVRLPSLAVDPATGIMYGGGFDSRVAIPNLYKVNPSTAELTLVGASGTVPGNMVGLDFGPDGKLYAAMAEGSSTNGGTQLAIIDKFTGAATLIGPFGEDPVVKKMGAIAFDKDGTLWGATENSIVFSALYKINLSTGHATFVANIIRDNGDGTFSHKSIRSIQFACDGTLYAGDSFSKGFGTIDTTEGTYTATSSDPDGLIGGLAFEKTCPISHGTAVGGTIMPVDMTALFVAGAFTNAFWISPTLGGIAGASLALFKVKRKHS